jgi:predicted alpha/beta hydrolase family esterase
MLRQILFVQGGGEGAHENWDRKLVESLQHELGREYEIRYPKMPNEGDPNYAVWKAALQAELDRLSDGAILIGHSVGGTILINLLAEQAVRLKLAAIILIAAPFIGQDGWPSEEIAAQPDLEGRLPHEVPVFLYQGGEDQTVPAAHVALYAKAIPRAHVRLLDDRDHQLNNDLSEVAADIHEIA